MKKVKVAAALIFSALTMPAFAQSPVNQAVDVTATLTTNCRSTTVGALAVNITYTAFAAGTTGTAPVTFECTRNFGGAPAVSFDVVTSTVAGLQYTLSAPVTGGNGGGAAASAVSIGTPTTYIYTVTATVPGNQAGSATAATTDNRQMTITF